MNISDKNKEQVDALQELLKKNYDAEAGYKQVMTKAESSTLKSWLQDKAASRSHFANELDAQIRSLNAEPATSGTTKGSLHRTWIDVKTALSSDTDEALLEECIRGEKASVSEYEEQMSNVAFNADIRNVLYGQKERIESSLSTVESLEEMA